MTALKHWEGSVLNHSKYTVFLLISSALEAKFSSRISACVSHCVEDTLAQPWVLACSYFMVFQDKHVLDVPETSLWCRKADRIQVSGHMRACNGRYHKHPWINKCFTALTIPDEWVPGSVPGKKIFAYTEVHSQLLPPLFPLPTKVKSLKF